MQKRTNVITFQGNGLTLVGPALDIGQSAPAATVLDNQLSPVDVANFVGKVCVISVVPSLDTPVCDLQTKRFNEEATKLGEDVVVLTISVDLPFAQARWCGAAGVDRVVTLSDYKETAFGLAYGVLIDELRLLARAVFVVDAAGVLQYQQIVSEISEQPDYEPVLAKVAELMGG